MRSTFQRAKAHLFVTRRASTAASPLAHQCPHAKQAMPAIALSGGWAPPHAGACSGMQCKLLYDVRPGHPSKNRMCREHEGFWGPTDYPAPRPVKRLKRTPPAPLPPPAPRRSSASRQAQAAPPGGGQSHHRASARRPRRDPPGHVGLPARVPCARHRDAQRPLHPRVCGGAAPQEVHLRNPCPRRDGAGARGRRARG